MNSPESAHNTLPVRPSGLGSEWVMRIEVTCGPEVLIGDTPQGRRMNYPILRGSFEGLGLRGTVRPGGEDWFLQRPDGLGQPDAHYSLCTDDGVVINIHNRALLRLAQGLSEQQLGPWPPDPSLYRCHCVPSFQAPNGRYEWLNQSIFVGEIVYPTEDGVVIDIYRLV